MILLFPRAWGSISGKLAFNSYQSISLPRRRRLVANHMLNTLAILSSIDYYPLHSNCRSKSGHCSHLVKFMILKMTKTYLRFRPVGRWSPNVSSHFSLIKVNSLFLNIRCVSADIIKPSNSLHSIKALGESEFLQKFCSNFEIWKKGIPDWIMLCRFWAKSSIYKWGVWTKNIKMENPNFLIY